MNETKEHPPILFCGIPIKYVGGTSKRKPERYLLIDPMSHQAFTLRRQVLLRHRKLARQRRRADWHRVRAVARYSRHGGVPEPKE